MQIYLPVVLVFLVDLVPKRLPPRVEHDGDVLRDRPDLQKDQKHAQKTEEGRGVHDLRAARFLFNTRAVLTSSRVVEAYVVVSPVRPIHQSVPIHQKNSVL